MTTQNRRLEDFLSEFEVHQAAETRTRQQEKLRQEAFETHFRKVKSFTIEQTFARIGQRVMQRQHSYNVAVEDDAIHFYFWPKTATPGDVAECLYGLTVEAIPALRKVRFRTVNQVAEQAPSGTAFDISRIASDVDVNAIDEDLIEERLVVELRRSMPE